MSMLRILAAVCGLAVVVTPEVCSAQLLGFTQEFKQRLVKCTVSDRGYNRQYDIPGSSRPATSNTECAEVCQKTRGCNLAVYVPTVARCYPKTVPVPQPGSTFQKDVYIVIPDGSDLPCGDVKCSSDNVDYVRMFDIPRTSAYVNSKAECALVCAATRRCTLAAYSEAAKRCYPKAVPASAAPPASRRGPSLVIPGGSPLSCGLLAADAAPSKTPAPTPTPAAPPPAVPAPAPASRRRPRRVAAPWPNPDAPAASWPPTCAADSGGVPAPDCLQNKICLDSDWGKFCQCNANTGCLAGELCIRGTCYPKCKNAADCLVNDLQFFFSPRGEAVCKASGECTYCEEDSDCTFNKRRPFCANVFTYGRTEACKECRPGSDSDCPGSSFCKPNGTCT